MNILGISAFYHDSAACLVQDGKLIAAAQQEWFSRKKHDERFPTNAISYCLRRGGLTPDEIDLVVFYDKPLTKFFRIQGNFIWSVAWRWRETRCWGLSVRALVLKAKTLEDKAAI